MANLYYNLAEKAVAFTNMDSRPYNREFRHIEAGFDKLPEAAGLTTGSSFFYHAIQDIDLISGLPLPGGFYAITDKFPGSDTPFNAIPGTKFYLTFPVGAVFGDTGTVLVFSLYKSYPPMVVGDFSLNVFLQPNPSQRFPVGTFTPGVIYEFMVAPGITAGQPVNGQYAQAINGGAVDSAFIASYNTNRVLLVYPSYPPTLPDIGAIVMGILQYNDVTHTQSVFASGTSIAMSANAITGLNLRPCNVAGDSGGFQYQGGVWRGTNTVTTPANGSPSTRAAAVAIWMRVG